MTYALNTARSVGAYNEDGSLMFYQRDNDLAHTYSKPFSIINERKIQMMTFKVMRSV